jgi:hypothetical protein
VAEVVVLEGVARVGGQELADHVLVLALVDGTGRVGKAQRVDFGSVDEQLKLEIMQSLHSLLFRFR